MQRKDIKKKSHGIYRSHYILLTFLMLLMSVIGTEYTLSTLGWSIDLGGDNKMSSVLSALFADAEPENMSSVFSSVFSGKAPGETNTVYDDIVAGLLDAGIEKADRLEREFKKRAEKSAALGRTNGVLADFVNSVSSGRLLAQIAVTLRTITHSDRAASVIFVIGSYLLVLIVYTFLRNVYSAAARRMFLEARVYEHVPLTDVLHFAAVRKWIRASLTMLVNSILLSLWTLTIIGGIIKHYSYWAVPYIVAENPSVSPRQALTLSRKMMNGRKWETFKFELSMIGWILLGAVSFGISDLIYGAGYRMTCFAEYYARLRMDAIARGVEGAELLNDPYLYETADRILLYDTYFAVVDELTVLHENKYELTGWRRKIADWFGIWAGSDRDKKLYDEQEGRAFEVQRYNLSMRGQAYPQWLNPLWRKKELEKLGHFSYLRHYTPWTLFLLFISFCFVGWAWEVALHYMQVGTIVNRGTLHGPWLPIYGTGGLIALILCSRFRKNPVAEFFIATALCGVLEYTSGWYLETTYHQRWWSYDGYFLNLHGRICAEGLLVFGVGCCIVVYLIAPVFDFILSKVNTKIVIGVSLVLAAAFFTDAIYSQKHPNMAEGAIEAEAPAAPASSEAAADSTLTAAENAAAEAAESAAAEISVTETAESSAAETAESSVAEAA